MGNPIRMNSTVTVRPDQVEAFRQVAKDFAARVEAEDHDTLGYAYFENEDGTEFRILEVHKDEAAIRTHLEHAKPHTRRFIEASEKTVIEVCGALTGELRKEIESWGVAIYRPVAGFTR